MYGLENLSNITILNLAYNEIAKIECKLCFLNVIIS